MTPVKKSPKTSTSRRETGNVSSPTPAARNNSSSNSKGGPPPALAKCADYKLGDPVFNVLGNITGMSDKRSPVSNMKMQYRSKKGGPPQLNFDIDLTKDSGQDEKYVLSNEPSAEEKEERMQAKLCRLEGELEDLRRQLEFVKGLRREWNAQKAGLCNRKLKDKPVCCKSDFGKEE